MRPDQLTSRICKIERRGFFDRPLRPLDVRVDQVIKVFFVREEQILASSPEARVGHFESVANAILDLAHCGNTGTALGYAADNYSLLWRLYANSEVE